jgi:DNA-binding transcriptional MerR regulator
MKSVNEASKLAGVSKRTLHYYDGIGLLVPSGTTQAGYRQYSGEDLARLWQIMFYKELDFSLQQIGEILNTPQERKFDALKIHKELLQKKKERLNTIIDSIEKIVRGEFEVNMLNDFDIKEIEEAKRKYGEEAQERWGNSEAYKESARRTAGYTQEDWARIKSEQIAVYSAFIAAMDKGCESPEAQAAVQRWHKNLSDNYYNCSLEMLAGLGQMYVADERFTKNIDKHKEGLADFMSRAIALYCKENKS